MPIIKGNLIDFNVLTLVTETKPFQECKQLAYFLYSLDYSGGSVFSFDKCLVSIKTNKIGQ